MCHLNGRVAPNPWRHLLLNEAIAHTECSPWGSPPTVGWHERPLWGTGAPSRDGNTSGRFAPNFPILGRGSEGLESVLSVMRQCSDHHRGEVRWDKSVIEHRRRQRSFGDGLIAAEVADLGEAWMRYADRVVADDHLVATVYGALVRRHPKSATHGRPGASAEMVLRLLVLKHVRNGSYQVLEREVRANLVYRDFTRVGARNHHVPPGDR